MSKIVYYVASSIDGYISGLNEDISGFVQAGSGVEQYLNDLSSFETVIMGRRTYEFGYQYGLQPGQPAYLHMEHYIFSKSLTFDNPHPKVQTKALRIEEIDEIRQHSRTDIYLCGGGIFAGWLLEHQQIDVIKLKLNPFIAGQGIKLFENTQKNYQLHLLQNELFDKGLQILTYEVNY
ncbi:MAG TPA: dihydrofolate reductase family protein [Saprospiraceae bacterium]|nr:dihydrofolate reductase family protein [Saprospiraceae bacterium]HMQ81377.1 dihydrofolate reductase family protein [Saprospiraceae bacterium]